MIAASALALVAAAGGASTLIPAGAVVWVRGETAFEAVCDAADAAAAPLPFASLSERVARPTRTPRGVGLRLTGVPRSLEVAAPRVLRVEHAAGERLARGPGRELWIVGPERLPVSAARSADGDELLPWLARVDANGLGGRLRLVLGELSAGERLVLVPCEGASADEPTRVTFASGEHRATCVLPARVGDVLLAPEDVPLVDGMVIEVDGPGRVDAVALASVRALDLDRATPLALAHTTLVAGRTEARQARRGEGPSWPRFVASETDASTAEPAREWWYESPALPPEGRATTLWLDTSAWSALPFAATPTEPRREAVDARAMFRDVAHAAGVDMVHMEGPALQLDIRPTMGPGAAWGDVDGDGWVDLFLPQGSGRDGSRVPTSRLFRNQGDGTFRDATAESGLALRGAGMGALFFDADGDLDLDLFVANYGANAFLVNDGRGHFTDATRDVGFATDRWHAAAAAADYDGDGDLDLYVTSYLEYDESKMPPLEELGRYQREDPVAMLPYAFPGQAKSLWRNDRVAVVEASTRPKPAFRFTDVAKDVGLVDEAGRGMQALFWDFDRDGDQDLYVANDVSPNRMWRNEGRGAWKDVGFSTGVDDPRGSMGLAAGDVDGDGDEDLFVTNWQLEANALYQNNLVSHASAKRHVASFRDVAVQAGLGQISVGVTGWGCELADFDLDGDLDLAYANGYTSPDYEGTGICVGQPAHYLENDGEGRFTPALERAGPDFGLPLSARACLACDYDQDGDLDLVVTANNGRVRLLRNELAHGDRHWLGVRLRGQGGNTHAIGAEVSIRIGARTLRRSLHAGQGYLSGNAPELHFGLGTAATIDEVRVRWPDGTESTAAAPSVDAFVTIRQP